jgi:UDP-3-O-[3-hydroxymyristoyl] glucosamine N-acyltransferase
MAHTVEDIAAALGAEAAGDLALTVSGAAEPAQALADQLAVALSPSYAEGLAKGRARAALVWPGADWQAMGLKAAIFAPRGRLAMAALSRMLDKGPQIPVGIHPTAVIDPQAVIGAGAHIGPFVVIGHRAKVAAGARIASHVVIGAGAQIGESALILEGVKIGHEVVIGDRVICHPGAVIGADGFSFVTPEESGIEQIRRNLGQRGAIVDQAWVRIHSLGGVTIGDDVEIGANATIDRGTLRSTSVGSGTKIDNLVHVGHNVQIGRDCMLCGQAGVAGSVQIGNRVVLGGQCGVSDNIFIGDDVICGGATKVFTNVPAGRVMLGSPAVKMETQLEIQKAWRRLPRLIRRVTALEGGSDADAD